MQKIHLEEIKSTNSFMLDQLANGANWEEGTTVYTLRQTAGRGQIGNSWESEIDKNITFSMLLKPLFLPIKEQFLISEITCIAIVEAINSIISSETISCNQIQEKICIKWPNDIYIGDDKLCGILIENSLQGCNFAQSILGIGINVNQENWIGNAPNPTSLKLKYHQDFSPVKVLDKVTEKIWYYYILLQSGMKEKIHSQYLSLLYRREGFHKYKDAESGKEFAAKIMDVEPSGYLLLEEESGEKHRYMFKEVKFVLPCGVTKE